MARRKKGKSSLYGTIILLCIICMLALTGCLFFAISNHNQKSEIASSKNQIVQLQNEIEAQKDVTRQTEEKLTEARDIADSKYTAEEMSGYWKEHDETTLARLKEDVNSGMTMWEILKDLYPDQVVCFDAGQYYFFDLSPTLARNNYILDNFGRNDHNIMEYRENDQPISQFGIDVSKYQGKIDWEKTAGMDVKFAFIRVGNRGATKGDLIPDDKFEDNMKGAIKNGIDAGVYFFTEAISTSEAVEEAEYVLEAIEPYKVTYPVVIDVEYAEVSGERIKKLTKEERTKCVIAFCEKIKEAGYTPMIYGNLKTFMLMLDMEQLEDYDKWFACYLDVPYFPYEYQIWQYSSKGKVSGISGNCDINITMKDYSKKD